MDHLGLSYPFEYLGPRPIEEQIGMIAEIFDLSPDRALRNVADLPQLPTKAEGWFAVPSVSALLDASCRCVSLRGSYCSAVRVVNAKLWKRRNFHNYRSGQFRQNQLRQVLRTVLVLSQLESEQQSNILIVAAQLGLSHAGRSVSEVRETLEPDEFCLDSVAVGSILSSHPERMARLEDLGLDCAGDEFASGIGGQYDLVPYYFFNRGRLCYGAKYIGNKLGPFGAVTGFLTPAQVARLRGGSGS